DLCGAVIELEGLTRPHARVICCSRHEDTLRPSIWKVLGAALCKKCECLYLDRASSGDFGDRHFSVASAPGIITRAGHRTACAVWEQLASNQSLVAALP